MIRTIRIVSGAYRRPLQWKTIHPWNGKRRFREASRISSLLSPYILRSMIRSLSSRSAVSEIMMDDDYHSSSSAASSRNTSRVQQPFAAVPPTPAQRLVTTSLRLEKLVVSTETETDILNSSANGANQWNYLPQTVWKQTAEVKQINFD